MMSIPYGRFVDIETLDNPKTPVASTNSPTVIASTIAPDDSCIHTTMDSCDSM